MELVARRGELVTVDRGDPEFPGSVLALGCAGIVTALTLDLVPAFEVRQWVYEDVPLDDLGGVLAAAYSVSAFTSFAGPAFEQVWLKRLVVRGGAGAALARRAPGRRAAAHDAGGASRSTPPSRAACPGRGTSGCRTSGRSSRPASATSCSRSTWWPASTPTPRWPR